jgi:hypothetical protein
LIDGKGGREGGREGGRRVLGIVIVVVDTSLMRVCVPFGLGVGLLERQDARWRREKGGEEGGRRQIVVECVG